MATLEIPSNVKCITSGQVPTTANLKDGEFAFGKVGGIAKLYGNVNGVIIDFTGDGGGVTLPITYSGTGESGAVSIIDATYSSGYPGAAMISLKYGSYGMSISPVMFTARSGSQQIKIQSSSITYTPGTDESDAEFLREDNVKTLFGNQSIYGSGNIDLYKHNLHIVGTTAGRTDLYCQIISSNNLKIDSLTDLQTILADEEWVCAFGLARMWSDASRNVAGLSKTAVFSMDGAIGTTKTTTWALIVSYSGGLTFTDTVTTV